MSLEMLSMSLGVGLEQELGDEFGVDFAEFDEFGGAFVVCLLHLKMRLMSLEVCDEFWGCVR